MWRNWPEVLLFAVWYANFVWISFFYGYVHDYKIKLVNEISFVNY